MVMDAAMLMAIVETMAVFIVIVTGTGAVIAVMTEVIATTAIAIVAAGVKDFTAGTGGSTSGNTEDSGRLLLA